MILLSIIIPVFNAEKTLRRAMVSLMNLSRESQQRTEIIIVDDGSTDGSRAIADSMLTALAPLQVVIISQPNRGTGSARNAGIASSRGEWVFFLDADDQFTADPVPCLERHPNASAIAFSIRYEHKTRPRGVQRPVAVTPANHLDLFTARNAYTVSSLVFRKQLIQEPFDEDFRYLEDWLFWIMNPALFGSMAREKNLIIASIHVHGTNKSGNYGMAGRDRIRVAERVMERLDGALTPKQKNNLRIQVNIGLILQNKPMRGKSFLLFPCSAGLYVKFAVYALLKNKFRLFDRYGTSTS